MIFIASGSYLIGKDLATLNNVPLLEIKAKRVGGKAKKYLSFVLKLIPRKLKIYLRKKEINSEKHEKNTERNVSFDENIWQKYKKCKNILLVDDSIDTGNSMKSCYDEIRKFFLGCTVKIAALNIFTKAEKIIKCEFNIYKDTMLAGPWSNDSKENKLHNKIYKERKKKYIK